MYVFRGGAFVTRGLSPTEMQVHLEKWTAWSAALIKSGHRLGGHPVRREGKCVSGKDRVVTDGPYAESKDLVTGNLVIEAPSLEVATELAADCPIFEFDGSVEVRPIIEEGG
jgi:hypothetical protein